LDIGGFCKKNPETGRFLGRRVGKYSGKNSALYSLQSGLSNEVSLGIPFYLKKKVRGGCALPGGDVQKSYAPKCEQGKTKIDLFWVFLQKSRMSKL
jgi:hypothetical protein